MTQHGDGQGASTYAAIPYAKTNRDASSRLLTYIIWMVLGRRDLEAMTMKTYRAYATLITLNSQPPNRRADGMPSKPNAGVGGDPESNTQKTAGVAIRARRAFPRSGARVQND